MGLKPTKELMTNAATFAAFLLVCVVFIWPGTGGNSEQIERSRDQMAEHIASGQPYYVRHVYSGGPRRKGAAGSSCTPVQINSYKGLPDEFRSLGAPLHACGLTSASWLGGEVRTGRGTSVADVILETVPDGADEDCVREVLGGLVFANDAPVVFLFHTRGDALTP